MELCSTCHADASGVSHRCRDCRRRCHAICGESVGATEGFASLVLCTPCARSRASTSGPFATTTTPGKRAKQHVVTISERQQVICWMIEQQAAGVGRVSAQAITQFPLFFRGSKRANDRKAKNWWDNQAKYLQDVVDESLPSASHPHKRASTKARSGRGRKRSEWVSWLYSKLYDECLRLQAQGLKVTTSRLREAAENTLKNSSERFNARYVDKNGSLILTKITTRWIQTFRDAYGVDGS